MPSPHIRNTITWAVLAGPRCAVGWPRLPVAHLAFETDGCFAIIHCANHYP